MGMSIKNAEVERLARELARLKGVSMTEAIRQALESEVQRNQAETPKRWDAAKRERIERILAEARELKIDNSLTEDEILGYDENGLPN